jgi:hypothetical protein
MLVVIAVPVLEVPMNLRLRKPASTSAHRTPADSAKLYGGEVTLDMPFNNALPKPEPDSQFILLHSQFVNSMDGAFNFRDDSSESIAGVFGFVTTDELLQGGPLSQFLGQFNDLFGGQVMPRLFGTNVDQLLQTGYRVDEGNLGSAQTLLRLSSQSGLEQWNFSLTTLGRDLEIGDFSMQLSDPTTGHRLVLGVEKLFFFQNGVDPVTYANDPASVARFQIQDGFLIAPAGSMGDVRDLSHRLFDQLAPQVLDGTSGAERVTESHFSSGDFSQAVIDIRQSIQGGDVTVDGQRRRLDFQDPNGVEDIWNFQIFRN